MVPSSNSKYSLWHHALISMIFSLEIVKKSYLGIDIKTLNNSIFSLNGKFAMLSGPHVSAIFSSVKINEFISLQRQLLFSLMITQYSDQKPLTVQALLRVTKDGKSRWAMINHAINTDSKNKKYVSLDLSIRECY